MDRDNYEVIHCEGDGDYRVHYNICDLLCIERFNKNHLKSQTHTNIIRKREQLMLLISNNLLYLNTYWRCELCDNIMNPELRNKQLETKFHSSFINSILRRYIIPNPNSKKNDDMIRKYFIIHNKKDNNFQVVFLLKLLMPSNQNKYIRIQRSNRCYRLRITQASFFSKIKIIKEQYYSQVLELRITFVSSSKNMTYEIFLNQPKSLLEWKLFEKLDKNP